MNLFSEANLEATKYGGVCLRAPDQQTHRSLCEWRCGYGHQWQSPLERVKEGFWCQVCIQGKHRYIVSDMQELALSLGGMFLSPGCLTVAKPHRWRCKDGHEWMSSIHQVKKRKWCKKCADNKQRDSIEMMRRVATERKGECLSSAYVDQKTKLCWQCEHGHEWEAQPANVKMGQWCPECARNKLRLTLQDVQKFAEKQDGRCLAKEYHSNTEKILWECKKGHQWLAPTNNISMGSWCPDCARNQPYSLDDMKKLAAKYEGLCISKKYTNSQTKMDWQCKRGHVFKKTPTQIIGRKSFCKLCYFDSRRSKPLL